jgi:hypothetical protein
MWNVQYFYRGEWITFARHADRSAAIRDVRMLQVNYKARALEE